MESPAEPHVAVPQFLRAHARRAESHGGFTVEITPILGEQASGSLEVPEDLGLWKRGEDADGGSIQSHPGRQVKGPFEAGRVIAVESEHDPGLDGDSMGVDPGDG